MQWALIRFNVSKMENCDHASSRKDHLKLHKERNHGIGEKKFLCKQCSYKSNKMGSLMKHIKTCHHVELSVQV